jgi:hypothetical protein
MITVPTAPWAHVAFEIAAWLGGLSLTVALYRWRLTDVARASASKVGGGYFVALVLGAVPGAWLAGSLNTLRGRAQPVAQRRRRPGRRYRGRRDLQGAPGREAARRAGIFVGSFSLGVVIGRLGCFFAGTADGTYGRRLTRPGASTWATMSRAILCSSTKAPRWRCIPDRLSDWTGNVGPTGRCGAASTPCVWPMAFSGSSGSSSSPIPS